MTMEFLVASGIGWVVAVGIYLLLRGRTFPVVLGLSLIGYGVNVFIFSMGRLWSGAPPILSKDVAALADPLPQALVLTAIVIGFATTGFVIELALRSRHDNGSDHVDARPDDEGQGRPAYPPGEGPGAVPAGDRPAYPPGEGRGAVPTGDRPAYPPGEGRT